MHGRRSTNTDPVTPPTPEGLAPTGQAHHWIQVTGQTQVHLRPCAPQILALKASNVSNPGAQDVTRAQHRAPHQAPAHPTF